jgi:hypothetical protein
LSTFLRFGPSFRRFDCPFESVSADGMKLEDPLDAFRPSFPVLMTRIAFLESQT